MRSIGLALLAATGCNQIFGISLTQPWDAHAPIDAPDWPTAITWQTFAAGQITNDPIDGLAVQVGSLDATFPLAPVTVDASGGFNVPYSVGLAPYRVVFMAPDGLPTEIQTNLQGFRYAFPIYGPHTRGNVPAGATFSGTATGATGYTNARLLTAGVWSVTEEAPVTQSSGGFSFMYQAQAVSLSGALGVPSTADGDVEVVTFMTGLDADSGFAVFDANALGSAGSAAVQEPPVSVIAWSDSMLTGAGNRITSALGNLAGSMFPAFKRWAGAIPTTMMPSFVQPLAAASSSMGPPAAPPPVMLPLDESQDMPMMFENPFTGSGGAPLLPLAVYTGDFWTRTVAASPTFTTTTYLTSSLQSITPATAGATQPVTPNDAVGIAVSTTANPATFGQTALVSEYASVALGGATTLPLTFSADQPVDDCSVVLFRIESTGSLTPLARYIITGTPALAGFPIMVQTKFLDTSSVFTFGIQCELGHDLAMNDFTNVTYPFSASTTFTATFTAH